MTPAQLDALFDYIEARAEVSEAQTHGEHARLSASCRLYDARNACRDAFAPPPEHEPTDEELGGP